MNLQRGFSMVGLMAVVAIIAIIAVVSLPVYNQYIERTKVSKEIPVIGTYKNDIASCFMKNDSLEDCNDGESGIHPGLDNEGKILSLDVFKGNIVMIIDAQNHMENVEPVELMYVVNPQLDATFPTLDWTLYCNDYSNDKNALVKECKGLITDKDGDGYDDSVEEEWGSDPLDPDSVPVNWQAIAPTYTDWVNDGDRNYTNDWSPEISTQTNNFTQTRDYEQPQTRERSDREQDSFSGDIRVINVETETQTITGQESRDVVVNNTTNGWTDVGGIYGCSEWTPPSDNFYDNQTVEQTRECSQDQENVFNYVVDGNVIETRTETQTNPVHQEQTVSGTNPLFESIEFSTSSWTNVGSRNYSGSWSPDVNGQTSDFQQTRPYTQEKERTIYERVRNKQTGEIVITGSSVETDTVSGVGTRTVSVTSTSWQNVGSQFDCQNWTPAPDTKANGEVYTQTGDCLQKQEKTYTYTASGTTIGSMTIERDQPVTGSRSATGTNESIVWVSISPIYGPWENVGSRVYTSNWSPAATTQTSNFTQTRSYTQEQERTVSQREENSSTGDIRVASTSTETRTISDSASRTVTVSEGAWINYGGVYSCGAWSPALGNQISDFTQTRSCLQDQTKRYTYSIGGSFVKTQTVTKPQSQVVEVTSTAGGSGDGWSSWSTYDTSCGSWSPSTSTVTQGQSFTQTRSCIDYQERFKYFVVNGQVVDSDRETRTTSRTERQTATGTKLSYSCYYNNYDNYSKYYTSNSFSGIYGEDGVHGAYYNGQLLGVRNSQFVATEENPLVINGKEYFAGAFREYSHDGNNRNYEICVKN